MAVAPSSNTQQARTVFSQGDAANAVFYILEGKVKLTVVSEQGKEAVVAVVGPDEFFGEGCLTGQRSAYPQPSPSRTAKSQG